MPNFDLLNAVQPPGGWYAVIGIKDGGDVRQRLVETREEFDQTVSAYMANSRNVFFGVAKFKADAGRGKDNVEALKSLWLDIDCGPTKAVPNEKTGRPDGYPDQISALSALKTFCKTVGLPKPIIINSGRGLHVYWPLTEAVSREEWEPVAARLRDICVAQDLFVDPAVFEVSRVLRVPGTLNFKDDPPTTVTVVSEGKETDLAAIKALLGVKDVPVAPKKELTELGKSLISDLQNNFAKIMKRSMAGTGCQQLLDCYRNQDTLPEPRWRSALSIAKFCVDRDKAIHKLSSGYPGYDPVATEEKVKGILGPHTCAVFEQNNPGGCTGCPHLGKIKSPIMLGTEVLEAEPEAEDGEVVLLEAPGEVLEKKYVIPSFPEPYFRGKSGGVWRRGRDDEEAPVMVHSDDFYIFKRMEDPEHGDVSIARLHTPKDGIKEFMITNAQTAAPDELRKLLASKGMVGGAKFFALVLEYLFTSINVLRHAIQAEKMRLQFGWADNDSKFIVGDREITVDGVYHSPPSTVTAPFAAEMQPVGSFEKWKEVFNLYGLPGMEPHAFAAATAFGSPLLKFLGQSGGMINVIHPNSGTGKTTILRMCNSVWGHPVNLCMTKDDTYNAKVLRMGINNNLPTTIDEITNTKAEEFSNLIYNASQGRGKDRVKQSSNELRHNATKWQSMTLTSSNASFYEKMASAKRSPDGELMRLLEYKIEYSGAIDMAHAKDMFDHVLMENYGHAGIIYGKYLVAHQEECRALTLSIQSSIDKTYNVTQRERVWSAMVAANIAGIYIAHRAGLLDWDKKAIMNFAGTLLTGSRDDAPLPLGDTASIIGDYINRHINNVLVVNDGVDRRSQMPSLPVMEPKGELLARFEPDTKKLYIPVKTLKDDCVKYQVNYRDTINALTKDGVLLTTEVKRLSKGMKINAPGVRCIVLDTSAANFLDVENFIEPVVEGQTDEQPNSPVA